MLSNPVVVLKLILKASVEAFTFQSLPSGFLTTLLLMLRSSRGWNWRILSLLGGERVSGPPSPISSADSEIRETAGGGSHLQRISSLKVCRINPKSPPSSCISGQTGPFEQILQMFLLRIAFPEDVYSVFCYVYSPSCFRFLPRAGDSAIQEKEEGIEYISNFSDAGLEWKIIIFHIADDKADKVIVINK
ncbi:CLUMA_CG016821, isoform A [Clunio marinus]|uniref:CLUMA_CG016821, isoform A n=1 Tax=Clunio marinus TaxID=568069 RepID=A0A1J1IU21_9DIPT|nr:CLUMA_CG016821, isoform A [Clunio marinus]